MIIGMGAFPIVLTLCTFVFMMLHHGMVIVPLFGIANTAGHHQIAQDPVMAMLIADPAGTLHTMLMEGTSSSPQG